MCGRYALALRPSQVRQMLQDQDMPVADMPDEEGSGAPRQSYNFAPGYHGIVYRADTPDWGAGPRRNTSDEDDQPSHKDQETLRGSDTAATTAHNVSYKLQSMKWGLVPFWTKRNPDYSTMMRTINCRDDSLSSPGGMWATMKARKRCIVIAQGFFEWLKVGPKEKLPHYVKRKDGHLMCFAGLWDCVQFDDSEDKTYTYTIITTDSNKELKFLHDRMPVILNPGSSDLRTWLDPTRYEWSRELQSLLKPFNGELEVYPVSKDVGKVGNNSPSFLVPLDSKENKSNIVNFFAKASSQKSEKQASSASRTAIGISDQLQTDTEEGSRMGIHAEHSSLGKRKTGQAQSDGPPTKKPATNRTGKISATQNDAKSPPRSKGSGAQKITKFFPSKS